LVYIYYFFFKKYKRKQLNKITLVQILRSPEGGIRKHVVDILENLSREHYDMVFITDRTTEDRDLNYLSTKHSVGFYDLKIIDRPGFRDIVNIVKIAFFLIGKKNMILHGHGAKGGLYARVCSLFLKCKSVYTPHGGSLHRVFGATKAFIFDSVEKLLVPFTDLFIFDSQYSRGEFQKYICNCSDKSIVNYNGVVFPQSSSRKYYAAGDEINIASFGLLRKLKGHDIVIEALALLKKKNIPFKYTIYGYGEEKENLLNQIKESDLNHSVKIRDFCSDILEEMKKYHLIIHPSRFESFGYVPVEAMSVKVPVLTSFEGGLKEVAQEPLITKTNTPFDYEKFLEGIYNGSYNLEKIALESFEEAKNKFSISLMIKVLDSSYRKLVKH